MAMTCRRERHLNRRVLRKEGIDPLLWYVHFGDTPLDRAECADCADFLFGFCRGGREPRECMRSSHRLMPFEEGFS